MVASPGASSPTGFNRPPQHGHPDLSRRAYVTSESVYSPLRWRVSAGPSAPARRWHAPSEVLAREANHYERNLIPGQGSKAQKLQHNSKARQAAAPSTREPSVTGAAARQMTSVSATPSTRAEPNLAPAAGVVRALERKHVDVDLVPACMSSVNVADCALANMQCAPYCVKHRGTRHQRLRLSHGGQYTCTCQSPHARRTHLRPKCTRQRSSR